MIYYKQKNDYCYKKTISKNKDVLAAAKEVGNSTRPLKMEIENVVSVTICQLIIKIHIFKVKYSFQLYAIKYQEIWVQFHQKIEKINWLLEKQTELDTIRYVFDHMKYTINMIYDEPLSVEIGPLEIQLGDY